MGNIKPHQRMQAGQSQVMTQQLLQSIRLLQLTTQELELEVRQALDSNLMLEADEAEPQDDGYDSDLSTIAEPEAAPAALEVTGDDAGAREHVEADFDWSSSESWSGGEPADEDGEPAAARIPDALPTDPHLNVLAQLQLLVSDPRQAELVAAIIDAVDDSGYLSLSLDMLLDTLPASANYTMDELHAALRLVQSCEPTGFAARNLAECLRLQLEALPTRTAGRALALRIVDEHLDELGTLTEHALALLLDYRVEQIHLALALIKALDPKPGAAGALPALAVEPEVIVTGQRGAWKVELNSGTLPRIRINRSYERAIGSGAGSHRALRDQLNEARWLVRGLEMRHETLLKTARVVFERQAGFLRSGEEAMAPLNLADVADAIGMHESTVSRVVANKYALTPWGVYPLKAFFPVQIAGRDADTSGTAVRAMIRKIIDAENRSSPLSDGDVAALLARRGVTVARRTVAKYREAMRIPSAPLRVQRPQAVAG